MDVVKLNQLGAYTSVFILSIINLIFIFRLQNQEVTEYWLGIVFMVSAVPLLYLIYTGVQLNRPTLYFIQLGIMIGFIILELLLDYIFKFDFRHTN